jgi:hypothetical protein
MAAAAHRSTNTFSCTAHRRWKELWREILKATDGKRSSRTSMAELFGGREIHSGYFGVSSNDESGHTTAAEGEGVDDEAEGTAEEDPGGRVA